MIRYDSRLYVQAKCAKLKDVLEKEGRSLAFSATTTTVDRSSSSIGLVLLLASLPLGLVGLRLVGRLVVRGKSSTKAATRTSSLLCKHLLLGKAGF